MSLLRTGIMLEIQEERTRQVELFGDQSDLEHTMFNCILVEEIGEVSKALQGPGRTLSSEICTKDLEMELIQAAGVIVAWVEKIRSEAIV